MVERLSQRQIKHSGHMSTYYLALVHLWKKISVERMRKLRIKGWDEGGHKKKGKSTNEGEGEKGWHEGEGDNDTVPTNTKGQKMRRGPMTCRRCGQKGHRQASSKCPLNGTAKGGN